MEQPILMIFVIFFNVLVFLTMVRCSHAVLACVYSTRWMCLGCYRYRKNFDIIV